LNINGQRVQIAVSKTLKGKSTETVWVGGLRNLDYGAVADPRERLTPGDDYIFLLRQRP